MNEGEMRAALDAALMTDAEMTGGPAVWAAITDPFPAWPTPGEADTPHTPHTPSETT
jgi:hypothetical protein